MSAPAVDIVAALADLIDPAADIEYRRVLCREAALAEHHRARAEGYAEGYAQAETDMAAAWRAVTEPIAHPGRGADRRLQAAIAGGRRDQGEHERAFVARAYATDRRDRTDLQQAAVFCYPPPPSTGRAAR